METGLKGKVAIVTGAGSQIGFGKAIVEALAREGCKIVAADIDLDGAKQTAREAEALGVTAIAVKTDITNNQEVEAMIQTALEKFGQIDVLVNNAGSSTPPKPFLKITPEEFKRDVDVNLIGTMYCTRAVLPHMIERKYGKIVNITSGAGIIGGMFTAGYSAAKGGVRAFTMGIANEFAPHKININLVSPGVADTGFAKNAPPGMIERVSKTIPTGRITEPKDIANAVVFLASDASEQIVGQTIVVTGSVSP